MFCHLPKLIVWTTTFATIESFYELEKLEIRLLRLENRRPRALSPNAGLPKASCFSKYVELLGKYRNVTCSQRVSDFSDKSWSLNEFESAYLKTGQQVLNKPASTWLKLVTNCVFMKFADNLMPIGTDKWYNAPNEKMELLLQRMNTKSNFYFLWLSNDVMQQFCKFINFLVFLLSCYKELGVTNGCIHCDFEARKYFIRLRTLVKQKLGEPFQISHLLIQYHQSAGIERL